MSKIERIGPSVKVVSFALGSVIAGFTFAMLMLFLLLAGIQGSSLRLEEYITMDNIGLWFAFSFLAVIVLSGGIFYFLIGRRATWK